MAADLDDERVACNIANDDALSARARLHKGQRNGRVALRHNGSQLLVASRERKVFKAADADARVAGRLANSRERQAADSQVSCGKRSRAALHNHQAEIDKVADARLAPNLGGV